MAGTKGAKEQRRKEAERRQREYEAYLKQRRRQWWMRGSVAVVVVGAVVGLGFWVASGSPATPHHAATKKSNPSTTSTTAALSPLSTLGTLRAAGAAGATGPQGVPVPSGTAVAPAGTPSGDAIDGFSCTTKAPTQYRLYIHLTVYVNGAARQIPDGIGIRNPQLKAGSLSPLVTGGTCAYEIHTLATDGVIDVAAPGPGVFDLGEFFDIWGLTLSRSQVGPVKGAVVGIENGKVVNGDLRQIPLDNHTQIQLEVGRPLVTPQTITFPKSL